MESVLEFLKGFNVQTIASLAVIVWYFNRHIESKLERMWQGTKTIEVELKELVKTQSARSDKLYEMFVDLLKDRRGT